jgi:hypothetical protein
MIEGHALERLIQDDGKEEEYEHDIITFVPFLYRLFDKERSIFANY